MYIEPNISGERRGCVEVICGSMFSGKTEELIRRLKRVKIANLRFRIFKPVLDTRFDTLDIVSHDENAIVSTPVQSAKEIIALAEGNDVVGIDEAQFFDNALADVCDELALSGIRVIVAGLDMDYSGKPFGPIPSLLAKADFITKLHAICVKCGQLASHSFRKSGDGNQILLGATETYEPRCRKCFNEDQLH
jgi:thymidine kinase